MTAGTKPAPRILVKQDTGTHYFFAPCPRGLAPALAEELAELGAAGLEPADAGVAFTGPFDLIYTVNLHSRIASRILWRVAQFPYKSEDDVYNGAHAVRWHTYFNADRTFKVDTNAHRSPVKSLDFITLRVKDAIADQFRAAAGRRPSVESRDPDVRVHRVPRRQDLHALRGHQRRVALQARPARPRGRGAAQEEPRRGHPAPGGLEPGHGAPRSDVRRGHLPLGSRGDVARARRGRERAFGFEKLARLQRGDVGAHARQREEEREGGRAAADLRLRPLRALARPRGAQPARGRARGRGEG